MKIVEGKVDLLREAFSRFNATSIDLERSYQLLEEQVRHLKRELEEKNKALKKSLREKEVLREQAERNNRLAAVGEMAARMAHELRNPLGSIELFAALLRKDLEKKSVQKEWVEHIALGVRAMDSALSNLLLFTRKPSPVLKKINLAKMIEEARLFAVHLLEQNRIQFTVTAESIPDVVWCDEDLLRQVLLNLILNAVDAMPDGGEISVIATACLRTGKTCKSQSPSNEGVRLAISDTGSGIPKKVLPKIFDPFYTTKHNGTGLGLAIVHNAVFSLDGAIQVQSAPGNGTTFTVLLPTHERSALPHRRNT